MSLRQATENEKKDLFSKNEVIENGECEEEIDKTEMDKMNAT